MKKERLTSQKKIILDYLKSVKTHPSAEKVYLAVRKKLPQISQGTVYRILGSLEKKHDIQEIPAKVSHYDGDMSPHAHFICKRCDAIVDIFGACAECKAYKGAKAEAGVIDNYQINFYGVCKKCYRRMNRK